MKSIEDRYEEYVLNNIIDKIYSINPSLESKISELIEVKFPKDKRKIKASINRNNIIRKLKIKKREYTHKKTNVSYNYKKGLVLKSMLQLLETQEEYILKLNEIITFDNYKELMQLVYFLTAEYENNYNYLNSLMEYIKKSEKSTDVEYKTDYEDTREEVDCFFQKKYEELTPKKKVKKK